MVTHFLELGREYPSQMTFIQHDDLIEAVPVDGADQSLNERILARLTENVNEFNVDGILRGTAFIRSDTPPACGRVLH
jgi:hypothetical protein